MRSDDELTISEVSSRTGVAPSALRFYERAGPHSAAADLEQPAALHPGHVAQGVGHQGCAGGGLVAR